MGTSSWNTKQHNAALSRRGFRVPLSSDRYPEYCTVPRRWRTGGPVAACRTEPAGYPALPPRATWHGSAAAGRADVAGTHAGPTWYVSTRRPCGPRLEARVRQRDVRIRPHPPTSPHAFASTWPSMVPPSAAVARGTPWHVVYQHETRRTAYDVTGCASRATCAPPGAAAHRGAVSTQSTARCREYSECGTAPQSTVGDDSPHATRQRLLASVLPSPSGRSARKDCPYLPMPYVSTHCNIAIEYCAMLPSAAAASARRQVVAQTCASPGADVGARQGL